MTGREFWKLLKYSFMAIGSIIALWLANQWLPVYIREDNSSGVLLCVLLAVIGLGHLFATLIALGFNVVLALVSLGLLVLFPMLGLSGLPFWLLVAVIAALAVFFNWAWFKNG